MSFRIRLFCITALIVAAVLASVTALSWSSVFRYEVDRLDERLCMEARRFASRPPDTRRGSVESDVAGKLRLQSPDQLLMSVEATDGMVMFRSDRWDTSLKPDGPQWTRKRTLNSAPLPPPPPVDRQVADQNGRPPPPPQPGTCAFASFAAHASQWRAAQSNTPAARAVVAANLDATEGELLSALRGALTWAVPLAAALTGLGAWLLSSLAMRPVNRLRDAMTQVTQKALDQRLDSDGEDREFKDMINSFNTMLARLEASFHQASRFSSDAAHELKTPLTILQGRIEQALHRSGGESIEVSLSQMLDEVRRLSAITRKLLLLSQADAGKVALHITRVDLSEMLDTLMADAHMLGPDKTLVSEVPPNLLIDGDAQLLLQLFNNLISNALRYSPAAGRVHLRASVSPSGTEVVFTNSSAPIPDAQRRRFFDRFYRGDAAHSRDIEGSGLGLSLAREIARAHGGELTLEASRHDEVSLRLWLPRT